MTRVVERPCILVFDSVAGGNAVAEFTSNVILGYLQEEYLVKKTDLGSLPRRKSGKGHSQKLDSSTEQQQQQQQQSVPDFRQRLKRISPVVPLQDGDVDCGLFLLQFAESFFIDPIPDYDENFLRAKVAEDSNGGLTNWFSQQIIDDKRGKIRELILSLAAAAAKKK